MIQFFISSPNGTVPEVPKRLMYQFLYIDVSETFRFNFVTLFDQEHMESQNNRFTLSNF